MKRALILFIAMVSVADAQVIQRELRPNERIVGTISIPLGEQQTSGRSSAMNPQPFESIGVISLLSDELRLRERAALAFRWKINTTDAVPQWRIDEFVSGTVQSSLARQGGLRIVAMDNEGLLHPVTGRLSSYNPIFVSAEQQGLDAVAVILPYERALPDYFDGGYGLLDKRGKKIGAPNERCAYSWVVIELWDVDTRSKLREASAHTCDRNESLEVMGRISDYLPPDQRRMEGLVKFSLAKSVTIALGQLGLAR